MGNRQPTTAAWRVAHHGSAARGTRGDETRGEETRGDGAVCIAAVRSGVGSAPRVGSMPAERPLRRDGGSDRSVVVVAGMGAAAAAPVATAAAPSLTKRSVK